MTSSVPTPQPPLRPSRRVLHTLAVAAVLYGLLFLAGCMSYRRVLFPAPHGPAPQAPSGAALLELRAADAVPVVAMHFPAPPGARTVVHFHGNGETIDANVPFARGLASRGLGVLLVEYRGYGASAGTPTEEGLYLDAAAALDALAKGGAGPDRIVLSGTSLGTGVAAEMAVRGRGAALVLIAPYTSIPRVADRFVPFLPTSLMIRDRFDTLEKTARIHLPSLVIHGDEDEVIPYPMGQEVAAHLGAKLITVPGGHHNDLLALRGRELLDAIAELAGQ